MKDDGLKDCPYCEVEEGPDGERAVYDHQPGGVAVVCQECGMRGPLVEGMDQAAKLWATLYRGWARAAH